MNKKFERACILAGRKVMFNEIFDEFWRGYLFTPASSERDWAMEVLRRGESLPTYMSVDDFFDEFGSEVHSLYAALCKDVQEHEDEHGWTRSSEDED